MRCANCGGQMRQVDTTVERVERSRAIVLANRVIRECEDCGSEVECCGNRALRKLSEGMVPVDRVNQPDLNQSRIKDGVYED